MNILSFVYYLQMEWTPSICHRKGEISWEQTMACKGTKGHWKISFKNATPSLISFVENVEPPPPPRNQITKCNIHYNEIVNFFRKIKINS